MPRSQLPKRVQKYQGKNGEGLVAGRDIKKQVVSTYFYNTEIPTHSVLVPELD